MNAKYQVALIDILPRYFAWAITSKLNTKQSVKLTHPVLYRPKIPLEII
ncbi:MAG: hypothetical protein ACJA2G_002891 [Cognaticolwellia sp.]|jgi:hypothetical protein